jgi:transcriptional regulator with GAF, ATPase, and Fis domain
VEAVDAAERQDLLLAGRRSEDRIQILEAAREKLLHLLDIAGGLHRVERVEELLEKLLAAALAISGGDRAYLLQKAEDGTLTVAASRTRDGQPGDPDDPDSLDDMSHSILERVLEGGETLYVSDALSNPDFMAQRSVRELSLRTVVAVPLPGPSGVAGALYVDSRSAAGLLEDEGVRLLEALAAQAALAMETAEHRQSLVETAEALRTANRSLREALGERTGFDQILGKSPAMQRVFQLLERVVGNSVTLLIEGETGTGKELVAQALHFNGPRREANFIPVNCGAIPESLLESELFGYRKGAFTGAERDYAGLVEAAHGGTLFLDEIAEMSLPLQVKLLRMLQEGEVRRIGTSQARKVDVRIIAATHQDVPALVKEGRFREDLYYRINVVTIRLPPLRERGDDVLCLALAFLDRTRESVKRPGLRFGREAERLLLSHSWPGNVRELMNAVERAGALAISDVIGPEDLFPPATRIAAAPPRGGGPGSLKDVLLRSEEDAIRRALAESDGNVTQAARRLGVSRQHLHTRIRKFGLRGPGEEAGSGKS